MSFSDMTQLYILDRDNYILSAQGVEYDVKGKNYFDFAYDETLIKILKNIFDNVRNRKKIFSTNYRCDNDYYIRLFRLDIIPLNDEFIRLEHKLIQQKKRITSLNNVKKSDKIYTMCAWCNRILYNGDYIEIDDAVNKLKLFYEEGIPKFSHGICKKCKSQLQNEIERYKVA